MTPTDIEATENVCEFAIMLFDISTLKLYSTLLQQRRVYDSTESPADHSRQEKSRDAQEKPERRKHRADLPQKIKRLI